MMDAILEWLVPTTIPEADFLLVCIFGIAFIDKARDEFRTVQITDRLSDATVRTPLGWAYRNKSLTLGWLVLALGIVFILRGIPGWDEPRWVAMVIRIMALGALAWNKKWRRRAMRELELRLALALSGVPTPEEHITRDKQQDTRDRGQDARDVRQGDRDVLLTEREGRDLERGNTWPNTQ